MGYIENGWKDRAGTIMTPGSYSAKDAGCTCPVNDNAHGMGRPIGDGNVTFVVEQTCTVHKDWPEARQGRLAATAVMSGGANEARA